MISIVVSPDGNGIAQCCPFPVPGVALLGGISDEPESPAICSPTKS